MPDRTEILNALSEIIKDVTAGSVTAVTPETTFQGDLDLDSLTMVDIAVQLEEKFGVNIPDDAVPDLKKVSDAMDYISAHAT